MLDEIGLPHSLFSHVTHQLAHHVQLMIARENEFLGVLHDVRHLLLGLGFVVVKAHVVHDDVGYGVLLQDLFPHIRGLVATLGIHGIARALAVGQAFVERHEIGLIQVESRGEKHLVLVHGEVRKATSEVEQGFLGVAFR